MGKGDSEEGHAEVGGLRRRIEEAVIMVLMVLSLAAVLGTLAGIVGIVFYKGISSLSVDMVTRTPEAGFLLGGGGGILNAIAGSLIMASGAMVLSLAIGIGTAMAIQREFSPAWLAEALRTVLDIMWGIPSLIYGLFCFTIMASLGIGTSVLAGTIALALLMVPIMTRGIDESFRNVPQEMKEMSYSLGADRTTTAIRVVLRQAAPGTVSAVLIALGRGIGDAASVLYTSGFSDQVPTSLSDSAASLPTMVFFLSTSAIPEVRERAYAAAFVLVMIVLVLSVISRYIYRRSRRNAIR